MGGDAPFNPTPPVQLQPGGGRPQMPPGISMGGSSGQGGAQALSTIMSLVGLFAALA